MNPGIYLIILRVNFSANSNGVRGIAIRETAPTSTSGLDIISNNAGSESLRIMDVRLVACGVGETRTMNSYAYSSSTSTVSVQTSSQLTCVRLK